MIARLFLALVAATFACTSESKPKPAGPRTAAATVGPMPITGLATWFFDTTGEPGTNPTDFEILETNSESRLAKWGIAHDEGAPSGEQAFGVLESANKGQTYNLALAPELTAVDVDLSVSIKSRAGKIDQGGGLVFRAQGGTDYYVARWNPLENNVRFYKVVGEVRNALGVAEIELDAQAWHVMRVVVEGPRMEMFMNDKSLLVVKDDTHKGAGKVGLWTKADAVTLFDDLAAEAL